LLGISLELVPLIVKVAAINKIFQRGTRFRRVLIDRKKLYRNVGSVIIVVAIFLLVWTIVDPPNGQSNRRLTDDINEDGGQIIDIEYLCKSNSPAWVACATVYQFVLLVAATVLALQNRKVRQEFNDSSRLAIIIYGDCIFLLLRTMALYFGSAIGANLVAVITSFLLSADIIQTLAIYFVPKLYAARQVSKQATQSTITSAVDMGDDSRLSSVEKIRQNAAQKAQMNQNSPKVSNCPSCGYRLIQQKGDFKDDDIPPAFTIKPKSQDKHEK